MTLPRISKTSLNGILAFFIASVPLAEHAPQLHIPVTVMAWLSFAAGLARAAVGLMQQDADSVLAKTPDSPTPILVPAHPVPDDAAAQPVTPQP